MIGRQRMQYSMRSNNNIGVRDPEVISGICTTILHKNHRVQQLFGYFRNNITIFNN